MYRPTTSRTFPVNCGLVDSFPHQGQQHSSCPAYQAADPNRVPSAVLGSGGPAARRWPPWPVRALYVREAGTVVA
jgi:hypothetical protein